MTGVFQNALLGFQTGNQYGEQRRRRNALSGAGEMGAGGDWTGAQNALLKGGYIDEANAYGQFGEQARTRQTRDAVTTAVQGAGNDPIAGLRAGAGAALQGGDTDQFARLTDMANKMDDNQRARASEMQREQANLFAQLSTQNLPPEQAKARVLEALQSVPGMSPETLQRVQQKGLEEFTPDMMRQNGMRFMEAADVFARADRERYRTEDLTREDENRAEEKRRWNIQQSQRGPSAPAGYMWRQDGTGLMPIPGGPQDQRVNDTGQKVRRSMETQMRNRSNVLRALDEAEQKVSWWTTGLVGQTLGGIGGTAAHDLRAQVDTVVGNIGFEALQEMRANSPTGGALGQVAVREIELLQRTVANLENSQSEQQFRRNLQTVRNQYNASMNNLYQAYQQDFGEAPPEGAIGGGGPSAPAPRGGGQGGNADPLGWR